MGIFTVLFSPHLRALFILSLVACVVKLLLGLLWCCARTCCLVPRRVRQVIGLLYCVVFFVTAALTAYTLAESHAIERNRVYLLF